MRNLELDKLTLEELPINKSTISCIIADDEVDVLLTDNDVWYKPHHSSANFLKINKVDNAIRSVDWLPLEHMLYMGTGSSFHCFNTECGTLIEVVISEGYDAHCWNPVLDKLALVNCSGLVQLVTPNPHTGQWLVLIHQNLSEQDPVDIGDDAFVSIGWGSSDTQFQGSAGRSKLQIIDVSEGYYVPPQDMGCAIRWREDGDMLAVSWVRNNIRVFHILSTDGECLYENTFKPGLGKELDWNADGSLLATSQYTGKASKILFFEKNGLFKNECDLHLLIPVFELRWSKSLIEMLVVAQKLSNDIGESTCQLSIWTCTNSFWSQKQSLCFNAAYSLVNNLAWLRSAPDNNTGVDRLQVITSCNIVTYDWRWAFNRSEWTDDRNNEGTVAIIDGCMVRLTDTRRCVVPPPHCSRLLTFSKPVNFVRFSADGKYFMVIMNDYNGQMFRADPLGLLVEWFTFKLDTIYCNVPLSLNNFILDGPQNRFYAIHHNSDGHTVFSFMIRSKRGEYMLAHAVYQLPGDVIQSLTPLFDGTCSILINTEHHVRLLYDTSTDETSASVINLEELIPTGGGELSAMHILGCVHVFGLRGRSFYYNGRLVFNNVTSYLLCHGYVLLTTTASELLCYRLNELGLTELQTADTGHIYKRPIAQNSILVIAVPDSRKVVLQMARGDLEVVHPRVLSIAVLDKLLACRRYKLTYNILRADRIDPNVLYDINPDRFMNSIGKFIKAIGSCDLIDLFLVGLKESTMTEDAYASCLVEFRLPDQQQVSRKYKLHVILNKFVKCMSRFDEADKSGFHNYLPSVMTALACMDTDESLTVALSKLLAVIEGEVQLYLTEDDLLIRLINLTTIEKLYNLALAMQEFDLIQWIASRTQLDPLEYIPFFTELNSMVPHYREYKIYNHIKRYEEAFISLLNCDGVANELTQLLTKQNLFKLIPKHVETENQWYHKLTYEYAYHLQSKGQRYEAGIMFRCVACFHEALNNFIELYNVDESIYTIEMMKENGTDLHQVLPMHQHLASSLSAAGKYTDAALVYERYLGDFEEAIKLLVAGHQWTKAISLAHRHNRRDIRDLEILPTLQTYVEELCCTFENKTQQFIKQKDRLIEWRDNTTTSRMHYLLNDSASEFVENIAQNRDDDLESLISVASTTTQASIHSSNSSSTRRKKKFNKKIMLTREGGMFENIALVRELHICIDELCDYAPIVKDVCLTLLSFGNCHALASQLHNLYGDVIEIIGNAIPFIWPADFMNPPYPLTIRSSVLRLHIEYLELKYRIPPVQDIPMDWKLYSLY